MANTIHGIEITKNSWIGSYVYVVDGTDCFDKYADARAFAKQLSEKYKKAEKEYYARNKE